MKISSMATVLAICSSLSLLNAVHAAESTSGNVQPLADPIPEKIRKGDIVVEAVDFVRAPKTVDSSTLGVNSAYARIQYLIPIGDGTDRLLFNDLRGLLYLTDEAGTEPVVYLDLREQDVGFYDAQFPNEMGVIGVAFHPDFSASGRPGFGKFYTAYSVESQSGQAIYLDDNAESHESVLREWTVADPDADAFHGTSREVFRIGQFSPNHNIASIGFNTTAESASADYGMLYVSMGDGGGAYDPEEFGQSLTEPMAGIMRINPLLADDGRAYSIPADNPFVNNPAIANETWAFGLRHAQQFSFDTDGTLYLNDIGQSQIEEVNIGVAGANYGWRLREGRFATPFAYSDVPRGPVYPLPADDNPDYVYPVAQYDHDEGKAISSGFVYRGNDIPQLQGKYLFSDMVFGRVFYIDTENLTPGVPARIQELRLQFGGVERDLIDVAGYPNTYAAGDRADLRLGKDTQGELYLLTKGDGWIRKLAPVGGN